MYVTAGAADKRVSAKEEVMIFAAASLFEVVSEISDSLERAFDVKVKRNFGSSGTLARQIVQGETPDIFISASKSWINYIDSLGYIQQRYIAEVARNELVLITPKDSPLKNILIDSSLDFKAILNSNRLSVGDPNHVPAGIYAKEVLEYFGWFGSVKNRLVPAKDVRSALLVVEMGEAFLGIVYKTDAIKSRRIKVIGTFPNSSHKPINYVAGLCTNSSVGKRSFEYIISDSAKPIWQKYSFQR